MQQPRYAFFGTLNSFLSRFFTGKVSKVTACSGRRVVGTFVLLLCAAFNTYSQQALIHGTVKTVAGEPADYCTITIEGTSKGTTCSVNGEYKLRLQAGTCVLLFRHLGLKTKSVSVSPKPGESLLLNVELESDAVTSKEAEITNKGDNRREQVSLTTLDPKNAKMLTSAFGDFNKLLATLPGVVSNNELSSQYAVRGGSYDENLVYVNDMEIYRPFLVRSGQQEGLSFVNPDLVKSVEFSSGGWQPRFGDKLSSVLNIEYKNPVKWGGSVTMGLLTQQGHIEGLSKNRRVSFVAGVRRKSAQYLFNKTFLTSGLPVTGQYLPRFVDAQANVTINLTGASDSARGGKTTLNILFSYASNRYLVRPQAQQTDFGTIQQKLRVNIAFDGQEIMDYDTWQGGLKLSRIWNRRHRSDVVVSGVNTLERERINVEGGYNIGEVQTDRSKSDFNKIIYSLGVGTMYNYGRNDLSANILNVLNRNYYKPNNTHSFEYGISYAQERIQDNLYNYSFTDSTGYTKLTPPFMMGENFIINNRYAGYVQHRYDLTPASALTYGFRLNYATLNGQVLFSPRVQYSIKPDWKKDVVFRFATGYYQQAPFYREMRDSLGHLNTNLKAQSSVHFIAGSDLRFNLWNRPFKFTAEGYYKNMWHVVAYDVDNVLLRYYANNNTVAYAAGADFRVAGEFIKGAESWFSLGLMRAREDLGFDNQGYLRRPTDQLITFNFFFQDHLPNRPSDRVYVNTSFGSGLPFGPPRDLNNRAALAGPAYRRVDIGFSKVLTLGDKSQRVGRYFDTIWMGIEILNVLGVSNTINYTWIKDFYNQQWAVPNTLSTRFLNLKLITTFGGG